MTGQGIKEDENCSFDSGKGFYIQPHEQAGLRCGIFIYY